MTDEDLMAVAVEMAWQGVRTGNGEVGVVIAHRGRAVYRGYNRINASGDVTAHAEIAALRQVSEHLGNPFLDGYALYCTLEPCGMCTCACAWARLSRVVFGAGRRDVPDDYFELDAAFDAACLATHARSRLEVVGGVLRERCLPLYR